MKSHKIFGVFAFILFVATLVATFGSAASLSVSQISYPSSVSATAGSFQISFNLTNSGTDTNVTLSHQINQGTLNSVNFAPSNPVQLLQNESKIITATISFSSQAGPINGTIIADPSGGGSNASVNYQVALTGFAPTLEINKVRDLSFQQNGTFTITNNGLVALNNIIFTQQDSTSSPFTVSFNPTSVSVPAGQTSQQVTISPNLVQNFNPRFGDNAITIKASSGSFEDTEVFNFKKTFCSAGTKEAVNLTIRNIDVSNDGDKDREWMPLDEITIEVEIENKANDDVDDVFVEMALFDNNGVDVTNDLDFSNTDDEKIDVGNLNDDDRETVEFVFKIPVDLEEGSYKLAIKTYSDDIGEVNLCDDTSNDLTNEFYDAIRVKKEDKDERQVVVDNIIIPSEAVCGDSVSGRFTIFNIGKDDQDQTLVTLKNSQLNLDKTFEIREDLDKGEDKTLNFDFTIPTTARDGTYKLEFRTSYDYKNNVYRQDSEDSFDSFITVFGCANTGAQKPITIAASLQSDPLPGQELELRVTIRNNGNSQDTFTLDLSGYSSWASAADLSRDSVTLGAGESETFNIILNVREDVSGAQSFTIRASGNTATETQEVEVEFPDTLNGTGFNLFAGSNTLTLIIIGAVNLILIILIIIVAIRVARK